MNKWPHAVDTYSPDEVQKYCVNSPHWQRFRNSLKGLPTTVKLDKLQSYITMNHIMDGHIHRSTAVQISNYVNALKRGGQLDMQLKVVR